MMFRLILPAIALLMLTCSLPIAIIRAQPYDDSDLRAFLTPTAGCPRLCLMGIHPGETTAAEAMAVLARHDWVANLEIVILNDDPPDGKPILAGYAGNGPASSPRLLMTVRKGTSKSMPAMSGGVACQPM